MVLFSALCVPRSPSYDPKCVSNFPHQPHLYTTSPHPTTKKELPFVDHCSHVMMQWCYYITPSYSSIWLSLYLISHYDFDIFIPCIPSPYHPYTSHWQHHILLGMGSSFFVVGWFRVTTQNRNGQVAKLRKHCKNMGKMTIFWCVLGPIWAPLGSNRMSVINWPFLFCAVARNHPTTKKELPIPSRIYCCQRQVNGWYIDWIYATNISKSVWIII